MCPDIDCSSNAQMRSSKTREDDVCMLYLILYSVSSASDKDHE